MVTFRLHGPPLRFVAQWKNSYIANELDDLIGVPTLLSFLASGLTLCGGATVGQGSKNGDHHQDCKPQSCDAFGINSDWFSVQCDKVLRAIFKGLNVHLIDAWEMVLAHHLPNNLHPQPPIIKNIMDVLFSYTCPQKGG
ncbi:hypothetical protein F7725_018064 [Dissostichus mawsoni]|uniref:NXPE C-terminal domain-containing protein n=1 Tax=Dissostichus mawsoni TaxID=36200 RepID=A0A7J5XS25_DISMA|nr:hypothetical protein F7725_018064 [Dissostichus mawsoni]